MKTHLRLNLLLYVVCQLLSVFAIGKSGTNHVVLVLTGFIMSCLFTQFYLSNKNLIKEFYGIYDY
jgi:hypothetical protein